MAVTQAQIDKLTEDIASAERQITNGSQSVTYRSIDDLIKARDTLQQQFDSEQIAAGNKTPVRRSFNAYYGGRGYN